MKTDWVVYFGGVFALFVLFAIFFVISVIYNVSQATGLEYYQFEGKSGFSQELSGGYRQYQFSDGTTGQSFEDGATGIKQYNFSDGTQGYRYREPRGVRPIGIGIEPIGIDRY